MKRVLGAIALAASLSTPAMAGMGSHITPRYVPNEASIAARAGMPTVILGQAGTAEATDVLPLLRLPGWFRDGTFVAAPPATTGPRVVILLNPADPVAAKRNVCGDVSQLAFGEQGRRFVVRAAFCVGDEIRSRVTASEAPVGGADDPRLATILRRVTTLLFPGQTRFQIDPPGI